MNISDENKNKDSKNGKMEQKTQSKDATVKRKSGGKKFFKSQAPGFERPKSEFDQKILSIRRVTRVVQGGRRFSFSVALLVGNKKGSIGLGLGKAVDTALAINKAVNSAKKNIIKLKLTKNSSIPHELSAKFASSVITLIPNKHRGLVAGSVVRDIAKLAGIKDMTGKIVSSSKNRLNNAKATIEALSSISFYPNQKLTLETSDASQASLAESNNTNQKPTSETQDNSLEEK